LILLFYLKSPSPSLLATQAGGRKIGVPVCDGAARLAILRAEVAREFFKAFLFLFWPQKTKGECWGR